jgi:hypothetical protein
MSQGSEPSRTRAPRWRELGPLGMLARVAAAVFVATFVTLGVSRALPKEHWIKARVAPLEAKTSSLRLGSNWRMFVGEARFGFVLLETELPNGERYQLESSRWDGKSWWERAKDLRLRKLQAKLKTQAQRRRWGKHYLAFVCRTSRQELPDIETIEIIRTKPMILDDVGKRRSRPQRRVLATYDCDTGRFTEGK